MRVVSFFENFTPLPAMFTTYSGNTPNMLLIIITIVSFCSLFRHIICICSWHPSSEACAAWEWDACGGDGAGGECGIQVPGVSQHLHWAGPGTGSHHQHWTAARWAQMLVRYNTGLPGVRCHFALLQETFIGNGSQPGKFSHQCWLGPLQVCFRYNVFPSSGRFY